MSNMMQRMKQLEINGKNIEINGWRESQNKNSATGFSLDSVTQESYSLSNLIGVHFKQNWNTYSKKILLSEKYKDSIMAEPNKALESTKSDLLLSLKTRKYLV